MRGPTSSMEGIFFQRRFDQVSNMNLIRALKLADRNSLMVNLSRSSPPTPAWSCVPAWAYRGAYCLARKSSDPTNRLGFLAS